MKKVFDEIIWYCLGNKKPNHKKKHGKLKEYKNITKVQNWLSVLPKEDFYYVRAYSELIDANCKIIKLRKR